MQPGGVTAGDLISATRKELIRVGYTELTRKGVERTWRCLEAYLKSRDIEHFSMEVGEEFLADQYQIDTAQSLSETDKDRLRAINLLVDFQTQQQVSIRGKRKRYQLAPQFQQAFGAFMHERETSGLSHRTLETGIIYLERFSAYLDARGVKRVADIEPAHVIDFLHTCAEKYRTPTVYCTACLLRALFRYLHAEQLTLKNLALAVPKVRYDKQAKVPSAYSTEEIQRLLEAVDRGNPKGKRDYAILSIASRLGLRATDICTLTFENFHWDTSTIELRQHKTGASMVLPLLNDVGEAVVDYLKYSRPSVETNVVFLRLSVPIGPLKPPTLHSIVTHYMNKAGIVVPDGKKHGPHALRHSLASTLLHQKISLPVISEVLGHTASVTTSTYLKIDILQLRTCALEVPPLRAIWLGGDLI